MKCIRIGMQNMEAPNTIEECEEIRNFYKPYLDKYESKYRILYQLLQQPKLVETHSKVRMSYA